MKKVEMHLVDGKWKIVINEITSLDIDSILQKFPLTYSHIILYGYEDGHHFVVEGGRWMDDDDYMAMMEYDELEDLLDRADKKTKYKARVYITNRINEG